MVLVRFTERVSPKEAENMSRSILMDLNGAVVWYRCPRGACRSHNPPLASADAVCGPCGAGTWCQVGTLKMQLARAATSWDS